MDRAAPPHRRGPEVGRGRGLPAAGDRHGAGGAALRVLCPPGRARRRRRPLHAPAAAAPPGRRGEGCAGRVPQPGAGRRGARRPRPGEPGRRALRPGDPGEARDGHLARRDPGDDRPWCQGAGGADRLPARDQPGGRPARLAAAPGGPWRRGRGLPVVRPHGPGLPAHLGRAQAAGRARRRRGLPPALRGPHPRP